jgi:hypothetical protein
MRRIDAFHVRVLSPEKNTRKPRCHKRIMSFIGGFHTRPRGGLEAGSSTAQPTKQHTFRSGECRYQSFVCQVQENSRLSKYIREPASTQYLAVHALSAVFCIPPILSLPNNGTSPCQEIRFLAQYVVTHPYACSR